MLRFLCTVSTTRRIEYENGPGWKDEEHTFEADNYDDLILKLSAHRYKTLAWDISHGNDVTEVIYSYSKVMVVMSETPLDINELRAGVHHERYIKAVNDNKTRYTICDKVEYWLKH